MTEREWAVSNARGKSFAAQGEPDRALVEFEQAILRNPEYAVLYANRGGAKLQLGDPRGAIADCSRAIEMDPKCLEGLLNRAQARKELGDWQGAADDYEAAVRHLKAADRLWVPVHVRLEEARRKACRPDLNY